MLISEEGIVPKMKKKLQKDDMIKKDEKDYLKDDISGTTLPRIQILNKNILLLPSHVIFAVSEEGSCQKYHTSF